MGEKALQQVEQALQGGQQTGTAGTAAGAQSAQRRSQEDADRAMQLLLVISQTLISSHEAVGCIVP